LDWNLVLIVIATSALTGVIGSFVGRFGLWRTCRKLNVRVMDLEERLFQLVQRQNATRTKVEKTWMEEAMKAQTVPAKRRFDNDPPEF
jgi:hypothetical protein